MNYQQTVDAVNNVIGQYTMPLTLRQIYYRLVAGGLIPNPTKVTDSRSLSYNVQYGNECWELDALDPDELVRLVTEAVEGEVTDWDAWDEIKEKDERERKDISERLVDMRNRFEADQ